MEVANFFLISLQTLNFIDSLPKRERKPISQLIPNAHADGMFQAIP